ncbi:MAG TPA: Wzz/FepE/Etk N-terminal domain-containing protein [Anaerolineae bacterium]|nr:Wzz/FepE/Etk N-terminal domain-containing protein [Anaerolineae bacterium]HOR00366.1 Wzz/FepE/Etk N-terminal domain-containing protein [Anaerolineae bacterium]HPL28516.1 Wzz/FepE/Etk N-terminal domain-containing protein [Anaerolineae bacterium]
MPLKEYLRILWKRGWIVIVMAIVTTASAILFSYVVRPVYRSSIWINVIPARLDLGLTESIKSLMRNYSGNIRSNTTLQQVIDRTGQDMTPETLRGRIKVSPIMEDYVIQVDVDAYDPQVAQLLAQRTGEVFVEWAKTQMLDQDKRDRMTVTLRDPATPASVQSPKKKINALAGGVLGLVLGVLVVLGLEWLESGIIRSADDLERASGAAVLGVIPGQVRNA